MTQLQARSQLRKASPQTSQPTKVEKGDQTIVRRSCRIMIVVIYCFSGPEAMTQLQARSQLRKASPQAPQAAKGEKGDQTIRTRSDDTAAGSITTAEGESQAPQAAKGEKGDQTIVRRSCRIMIVVIYCFSGPEAMTQLQARSQLRKASPQTPQPTKVEKGDQTIVRRSCRIMIVVIYCFSGPEAMTQLQARSQLRKASPQAPQAAKDGTLPISSSDSGCSSPVRATYPVPGSPSYAQPYLADYGSVYHHLQGYAAGYVPVQSLPKVNHGGTVIPSVEYSPHTYQTGGLYQHSSPLSSSSNPQTSTLTVFYHDYTPR
ncbi:hypothetical protein J6590_075138 [Homalodisca vitripennis]|nr:hypothetical protein J6590_075138 [Homalodisca vitripennis]